MNPLERTPSKETLAHREGELLGARHRTWLQHKVEAFIDTHPLAAQALLAGTSAAALIEHIANENRWSADNPTLPLTLAVIFGTASLSKWLTKRYEGLGSNDD